MMIGYSTFCFMTDLVNALKLIQPIKDKFSSVTYADLFQLASAIAIEVL
jgi:catalase (peroxidase I)